MGKSREAQYVMTGQLNMDTQALAGLPQPSSWKKLWTGPVRQASEHSLPVHFPAAIMSRVVLLPFCPTTRLCTQLVSSHTVQESQPFTPLVTLGERSLEVLVQVSL
jgi:hypothetical protein